MNAAPAYPRWDFDFKRLVCISVNLQRLSRLQEPQQWKCARLSQRPIGQEADHIVPASQQNRDTSRACHRPIFIPHSAANV